MLTIQQQTINGEVVCRPVGEVDSFSVSQFRQALAEMALSRKLVIDLSGVTFVDSAGLGALVGGIRRTRDHGGQVAVACSRPVLLRLLETTGFDRIVTVARTVRQASESLRLADDDESDYQPMSDSNRVGDQRSA
jgi:anti-sigma B factor antagonist